MKKQQRKMLAVMMSATCALLLLGFTANADDAKKVVPVRIAIPLYDIGHSEIEVGTSRVLEVLYYSGKDDRNDPSFEAVTERDVVWETHPEGIVTIDKYGRLEALRSGTVNVKVQSLANHKAKDKRILCVVDKSIRDSDVETHVITYQGKPADGVNNLQKLVSRFTQAEAQASSLVPESVKAASSNPIPGQAEVKQGDVSWAIVNFADGSAAQYVKRVDASLPDSNRDKVQYFMGDRYLPEDGKSPISITDDGKNGIWVVGKKGSVNHIEMVKMGYTEKATTMNQTAEKCVIRLGTASGASWNGTKWTPKISDNDGLWTSMYGAGELMRYASLKRSGASAQDIAAARTSALRSLKAVLLIANISGREGTTDAKIRHLTNTRLGEGFWNSQEYLKEGKVLAIDNFVGDPNEGIGFYGIDAGKTTDNHYMGGAFRYSLGPISPEDWTTTEKAATTKRTLNGFIARTFCIPAIEVPPYGDGLFFLRNADGTQTVASGADKLYFNKEDHPILNVGNLPIPPVLMDIINVNGVQYQVKDMCYKGDTSTDEIIGHLFIYKIAYDILDPKDAEEKALKELVEATVKNYSQHLIDNGYNLVDATGQGTKWGKTTRDYFNSDFTVEDNSLNTLVQLMAFKLAFYMTGEKKWQDEYLLLAEHDAFKYADLAGAYWPRWMWLVKNEDANPNENKFRLTASNPSDVEMTRHAMYCLNYSDEEMAMLAYYLAFQLETDKNLLAKYKVGLNGWWNSMSHSENPLWYYIYQLAYPNEQIKDAYGNNLLETASWQLSRHPVDTRTYKAYFDGARPDVLLDTKLSVDPSKIIGSRTSTTDEANASASSNFRIDPNYNPKNIYEIKVLPQDERSVHKFNGTTFKDIGSSNSNNIEPATTYTLPYWFGVYHNMLKAN